MNQSERLALYGGKPVRAKLLPYGRQAIAEEDIQAVVNVLRSDWLTTGPNIEEFENAVAARVDAQYAVAFSSGTAALHGAVFAANLGAGDEAITSPLTFAATANCLLYQGATPVFADVCADTLTIDPNEILKRLTPRTKALLPVDYAGHPADLDAIQEIARAKNLIVIEDAAHALGATYHGKKVGSIADMTMFSFHPVKHITTGEGGIITTNRAAYYERLKLFRSHGINSDARKRNEAGNWFYEMIALGYNYRLTDIGAVLGLSQLKRLDANLARRREIAAHYTRAFSGMDGIVVPHVRDHVEPAWHLYPIQVKSAKLKAPSGRAEIFKALRAENIGVNVHYIPVHLHPYYRERFGYRGGEHPVAERAYADLISLPMFHAMTDEDVRDVEQAMGKVMEVFGEPSD
ncbi:UDP-4-amino-4,6-dideoxy-N-acetyl-beta-L-altrosamine transaminase [Anaerolineae bacterium CFX7]|nr:UDP-4-amino-4,6-dideoxy-N-acetyl-beta-L-altrosamine transaminase [Anaerolineae bacterium CFX7]